MPERPDFDLAGLLSELRGRARLLAAIAVAAAVLAFGASQLQDARYAATAELLFRQDPNENAPERTAATNLALANLNAVVVRVRSRLGLTGVPIAELRDRVELQPRGQADLVRVVASGGTAAGAARLANAFAEEVVNVRRETARADVDRGITSIDGRLARTDPKSELAAGLLQRRRSLLIDRALADGGVEIADRATPPSSRAAPKPVRNGLIGGVLGLLLAMVLVVLLRAVDRRMSDQDVAGLFGAPILARIPVNGSAPWRRQLHADAFQMLRANVVALVSGDADRLGGRALREEAKGRVLVVTSPLPANGKSTVVARLGEALAASGARVLAIDSDLRKPTLARAFGIEDDHPGLAEVLLDDQVPTQLVQATSVPGLSVLSGGVKIAGLGTPVASPRRLLLVVDVLRFQADILLVDTAPVAIAAETSILAGKAAGVIVVLDARHLDRDTLTATRDQLQRAGADVLGLVMNFAAPPNERALKDAYGGPYLAQAPQGTASSAPGNGELPASDHEPRRPTPQPS
jgi:capsular exopolysaccharide synthesis family protein